MQFLKSKHMILAMFIAPVLAIVAYFATDYMVAERPQVAVEGNAYKLAAKSNCRYQSGNCTLKNGDVEVNITAERINDKFVNFVLHSDLNIKKALISIESDELDQKPTAMQPNIELAGNWQADVPVGGQPTSSTMRLALSISGALYYAETPAVFVDYVTTFSRENFAN